MKYIIYILCIIAVGVIVVFLNNISDGNIFNMGLGDYIVELIGCVTIANVLRKSIFMQGSENKWYLKQ